MRYLISLGYGIKGRNVRCQGGEIDIVAYDPREGELVFVEVKSRSSRIFGWPEESVDARKRRRLRHAANIYLVRNAQGFRHYRFDIVALEMDYGKGKARVMHYKNIDIG